jgi:hypothetical protein
MTKKPLSRRQHTDAMLRRRIKFVAEKGAMARLFRVDTSQQLQKQVFRCLKPRRLASLRTRDAYDKWLLRTIESNRWKRFCRNRLSSDRWAYVAKLLNIVIYEIVSNRELFSDTDWRRIQHFLHIPIDSSVIEYVTAIDANFPRIKRLKGMTKRSYLEIQRFVREVAAKNAVPPIWFEAAWTA